MSSGRLVGLFSGSPKGSRGNKRTWLPGMAASQTYKGRHKEAFWSASFSNYDLFLSRLSLALPAQAAIFCVSIRTEARNEWQIVSTILSNRSVFYTWWADKMVYWAVEHEETVNSIMTFTPCRWEANAENGIRMIVLRVSGAKKLMISVRFLVPVSLVLLILKFRTLLEISFLEDIKLKTEHGQDSTDRRTVEFLGIKKLLYSSLSLLITILLLISYNI